VNAVKADWVPPFKANDCAEHAPFQHRSKANVDDLGRAISAEINFAKDSGGRLCAYRDGVYRPMGERLIRQRVKKPDVGMGIGGKMDHPTGH
jgi:hypothetical protein